MRSFFSERQWQWVADRYREGYTLSDLAAFLDIHRNTVYRGLIRAGVKPTGREELPPLRPRRAEFLRLAKMRGADRERAANPGSTWEACAVPRKTAAGKGRQMGWTTTNG